ncbi:hypothetical protein MTR67_035080 [Solanum verrucosum]|uniref:Uncharacterized protein n=1 Tax=Solanum verrucosum TaxID=315347 RepID=A0AAF0U974_SOLVR|nr:hypothetical protein MTR67_035080 [Solanum verrucosum]
MFRLHVVIMKSFVHPLRCCNMGIIGPIDLGMLIIFANIVSNIKCKVASLGDMSYPGYKSFSFSCLMFGELTLWVPFLDHLGNILIDLAILTTHFGLITQLSSLPFGSLLTS